MFFFCSHNELLDNLVKKTAQKNKKPKTQKKLSGKSEDEWKNVFTTIRNPSKRSAT